MSKPKPCLSLVLPGLLSPPPALADGAVAPPSAPSLARMLHRADRYFHGCEDLPAVLAVHAAAPGLVKRVAPLSWMAEGGDTLRAEGFCLRADPVSLVADRDRLRLLRAGDLGVTPEEAEALIDSLNAHFATDGLAFRRGRNGTWFLFTPESLDVTCTPVHALQRTDLRDAQPQGADAGHLTSWMNEVQMLLHEHPVNVAREEQGRVPVNGVWLWGPGRLPAPVMQAFDTVFADDALPRALGRRTKPLPGGMRTVAVNGQGTAVLVVLNALPWPDPMECKAAIEALETDWFAPLKAQLAGGRWHEVVIDCCDGRAFHCTRMQRYTRFWRRGKLARLFVE